MQAVLIALIVAAKFALPLLIVRFPFAAGWANFVLDGFDGDLLIPLGLPNEIYQPVDKLSDWVTYVAIVVVAYPERLADEAADARAVRVPLDRPDRVPRDRQRAAPRRLPELPRAAVPGDRLDPRLGACRSGISPTGRSGGSPSCPGTAGSSGRSSSSTSSRTSTSRTSPTSTAASCSSSSWVGSARSRTFRS